MSAVCVSVLKPRCMCWLRGRSFWTSLAIVFDSELKLGILLSKELSRVFSCNCTVEKLPVGFFNCCDCLVHNLDHSARLKERISDVGRRL